jgi:chlorophyll synthase
MKTYTWFAPAWSFMVGAVASNNMVIAPFADPYGTVLTLGKLAIGTLMAGPLLTGFSQVLNEWCDREVDAINQPERPIPAGLVGATHVKALIVALMLGALVVAAYLGFNVFLTAVFGIVLALGYSIEPFRFKRNGWIGNLAVGIAYESLGWFAGHLTFDPHLTQPWGVQSLTLALVYGLGAHGIMTINDFKSVFGDRVMGLRSIPAIYGEELAAKIAVVVINAAQLVATTLLFAWGHWIVGLISLVFIALQVPQQLKLIANPTQAQAVRYNIVAIPPYVWGMLAAAIGLAR